MPAPDPRRRSVYRRAMARRLFVFDPPGRFVAGTIGRPGARTFYLQAREGDRIASVSLEKVQVAVLAERLGALLDELDRRGITDTVPPSSPLERRPEAEDVAPLDEPLNEVFRAGTLSLGWDGSDDVIVIEAREIAEEEDQEDPGEAVREIADDDPEGPDMLRVRISPLEARRFVGRAVRVVASGRPPCPLCGEPLDPQGHLCPRRNGTFLH
jgi:uncharacterized repeat protein (TIGR03847 family)